MATEKISAPAGVVLPGNTNLSTLAIGSVDEALATYELQAAPVNITLTAILNAGKNVTATVAATTAKIFAGMLFQFANGAYGIVAQDAPIGSTSIVFDFVWKKSAGVWVADAAPATTATESATGKTMQYIPDGELMDEGSVSADTVNVALYNGKSLASKGATAISGGSLSFPGNFYDPVVQVLLYMSRSGKYFAFRRTYDAGGNGSYHKQGFAYINSMTEDNGANVGPSKWTAAITMASVPDRVHD